MTKHVKKLLVFLSGLSVVVIGVLMIFLPGPALVVIPAGLAILATEFVWAENTLTKIKEKTIQSVQKFRKQKKAA